LFIQGDISATTTRLEISFVVSGPPAGPGIVDAANDPRPQPNFAGVYPIELFRMFFPTPTELRVAVQSGTDLLGWYVQRSMYAIWNSGVKYACRGGGSYYIGPYYGEDYEQTDVSKGGVFALTRFYNGVFPCCNCYDLAAIAQLACSILRDVNGVEILGSRWVFQSPFGYINPGILVGYPQYPYCNSPFFAGTGQTYFPPSDRNNAARTKFGNHSWVEVTMASGQVGAIDATHGLEAANQGPAIGTLTRTGYLNAQVDSLHIPLVAGNTIPNDHTPGSVGDICALRSSKI
jgi:hypothetical protein